MELGGVDGSLTQELCQRALGMRGSRQRGRLCCGAAGTRRASCTLQTARRGGGGGNLHNRPRSSRVPGTCEHGGHRQWHGQSPSGGSARWKGDT
eukprot:gene13683-biopygen15609